MVAERAERADPLAALPASGRAVISVITVSELLRGVHRASTEHRERRRAAVERIISAFSPLVITEPVARVHAELGAGLAAEGTPIPTHDLWIAATALAYGLALVTLDTRHFERVPGLTLEGR